MPGVAGQGVWTEWVERGINADILPVVQRYGARLKKSGTSEYEGPCPNCGGTDRFSVNIKKRICNCRKCDLKGSVVDFVTIMTGGCNFIEAIEQINQSPRPDRSRDETAEARAARLADNAARALTRQKREEEQRAAEALKAKRDEEAITKVLARAVSITDTHGEAYLKARGLTPHKRLTGDIRFVADLDYWGPGDNGVRDIVHLATVPAVVALIRDFSGAVIGLSQTYLDPIEPRKWTPTGSPTNSPTKIRGHKQGGMIWLGMKGETLGLSEGWANALAFHQLGYGPEDMALAAAVDLGNLAGGATGPWDHPVATDADGRKLKMKNGMPDMKAPGVILPEGIKSIILIADLDSESYSTAAQLRTAANRFLSMGIQVDVAWPDRGTDWNDVLIRSNIRE
jgi:hypothetical protein